MPIEPLEVFFPAHIHLRPAFRESLVLSRVAIQGVWRGALGVFLINRCPQVRKNQAPSCLRRRIILVQRHLTGPNSFFEPAQFLGARGILSSEISASLGRNSPDELWVTEVEEC